MRYDQLEHAIRAACGVADDNEVLVFGSQAILATYPNPPKNIRASIEIDIQPKIHAAQTLLANVRALLDEAKSALDSGFPANTQGTTTRLV